VSLGTTVFFLMWNAADGAKPYRAVGGENIGPPYKFDLSFATALEATNQLLIWFNEVPGPEFHDLTQPPPPAFG